MEQLVKVNNHLHSLSQGIETRIESVEISLTMGIFPLNWDCALGFKTVLSKPYLFHNLLAKHSPEEKMEPICENPSCLAMYRQSRTVKNVIQYILFFLWSFSSHITLFDICIYYSYYILSQHTNSEILLIFYFTTHWFPLNIHNWLTKTLSYYLLH